MHSIFDTHLKFKVLFKLKEAHKDKQRNDEGGIDHRETITMLKY